MLTIVSSAWIAKPTPSAWVIPIPRPASGDSNGTAADADRARRERERTGDVKGGKDHERGENRMRQPEGCRDGDGRSDAREHHADCPAENGDESARRALERCEACKDLRDPRMAAQSAGVRGRDRESGNHAAEREDGPERHRARRRCDDEQRGEGQRACRSERRVDAARGPDAAGRVNRPCAERDLHRVAELRWCKRVDSRAHTDAGAYTARSDAGACGVQRRAPRSDRADEGKHEARPAEDKPVLFGASQGIERGADAVAEQSRGRGDGDERQERRRGERKLGA